LAGSVDLYLINLSNPTVGERIMPKTRVDRCTQEARRVLSCQIGAVLDRLVQLNNHYGRGDVVSVAFDPVWDEESFTYTGTVTRRIPITQKTGYREQRKFTVNGGTVKFLGHQSKYMDDMRL